jgi:hypothetical protein
MAVTFGTPVEVDYNNTATSVALVMPSVVSGQPIVVMYSAGGIANTPTGISDTFPTPYTWTVVDTVSATGSCIRTYIGTDGIGTSGTINLTGLPSGTNMGAIAYPCVGASLASGLSAVDVHGTNANALTLSLTPGAAGEGAVYYAIGSSCVGPGSPWVDTSVSFSGTVEAVGATYASPTSGTALAATWTADGTSSYWAAAGLIVKAAAVAPTSGFMAFM